MNIRKINDHIAEIESQIQSLEEMKTDLMSDLTIDVNDQSHFLFSIVDDVMQAQLVLDGSYVTEPIYLGIDPESIKPLRNALNQVLDSLEDDI